MLPKQTPQCYRFSGHKLIVTSLIPPSIIGMLDRLRQCCKYGPLAPCSRHWAIGFKARWRAQPPKSEVSRRLGPAKPTYSPALIRKVSHLASLVKFKAPAGRSPLVEPRDHCVKISFTVGAILGARVSPSCHRHDLTAAPHSSAPDLSLLPLTLTSHKERQNGDDLQERMCKKQADNERSMLGEQGDSQLGS